MIILAMNDKVQKPVFSSAQSEVEAEAQPPLPPSLGGIPESLQCVLGLPLGLLLLRHTQNTTGIVFTKVIENFQQIMNY